MRQLYKFYLNFKAAGLRLAMTFSAVFSIGACGSLNQNPECQLGRGGISQTLIRGNSLATKTVALTFERSPSRYTKDISGYLADKNIKSAFFIEGRKVGSGTLLDQLRNEGHLIANGTYSHADLRKTPELLTEIRQTDFILRPFFVGNLFLFNAPYGSFSSKISQYLNQQGLQKYVGPIGWDFSDNEGPTSLIESCLNNALSIPTCTQRYLEALSQSSQKNGILRFTDGSEFLLDFLKDLIAVLEIDQYKFVRLDEVPEIRSGLIERSSQPGTTSGTGACQDYN